MVDLPMNDEDDDFLPNVFVWKVFLRWLKYDLFSFLSMTKTNPEDFSEDQSSYLIENILIIDNVDISIWNHIEYHKEFHLNFSNIEFYPRRKSSSKMKQIFPFDSQLIAEHSDERMLKKISRL